MVASLVIKCRFVRIVLNIRRLVVSGSFKNYIYAASNIEQVLEAVPNKAAVRPPTTHHENCRN